MKNALFIGCATLALSLSAAAAPTMVECASSDKALMLSFSMDELTGDLTPDSLKISVAGAETAATAKQYMSYNNSIFIIASVGADAAGVENGYILDIKKAVDQPGAEFDGSAAKYSLTTPGTRTVDKATELHVVCLAK